MQAIKPTTLSAILVEALFLGAGCNDAHGAGGAGGTASTSHAATHGSSTGSSGTTAQSSTSTGAGGPPTAPVVVSVEPLEGGLHVMWTNPGSGCEKIEMDRNTDGGVYTTVFTLAGAATEQHDEAATAPGTYCYKLRCVVGAQESLDSNEKCGTP